MEKIKLAIDALSKREQRLIYAVIAVLCFTLLKFLVVGEVGEILALRAQAEATTATLATKERMLQEFSAGRQPAATANPNWSYYQENIGLSGLLRKISSKDDPEGAFRVVKIASEKSEKLSEYEKTSLKVEIEAPFNLIGSFLEDLESSKLLTRVEGLEVTRLDKELRLCHAKISLNSFAWRDK